MAVSEHSTLRDYLKLNYKWAQFYIQPVRREVDDKGHKVALFDEILFVQIGLTDKSIGAERWLLKCIERDKLDYPEEWSKFRENHPDWN